MEEYFEAPKTELSWQEHIRKRPGMYLGSTTMNSLSDSLVNLSIGFCELLDCKEVKLDLTKVNTFEVLFGPIDSSKTLDTTKLGDHTYPFSELDLALKCLIVLSESCSIAVIQDNQIDSSQSYQNGYLKTGKAVLNLRPDTKIKIICHLDQQLWKDLSWQPTLTSSLFYELSYLLPGRKFSLSYEHAGEHCRVTHYSPNGLLDWVGKTYNRGYSGSLFSFSVNETLSIGHLEVGCIIQSNDFQTTVLRSFVSAKPSPLHGAHVEGVIEGILQGFRQIVKDYPSEERSIIISREQLMAHLLLIVNIKLEAPCFAGATKSKLSNPEIVEPIGQHVAMVVYNGLKNKINDDGDYHWLLHLWSQAIGK